jgi:hypothetical protein
MVDKIFTTDERKEFEAVARRRGFKTLGEYLRSLVANDVKQHEEAPNADEDALGDPAESFRRAWGEAMRGETITLEEFRRRMAEDED